MNANQTFDTMKPFLKRNAVVLAAALVFLGAAALSGVHAGAAYTLTGSDPSAADSTSSTGDAIKNSAQQEAILRQPETEVIPFETVRVANHELPLGQERILQEGSDGSRTAIYEVTIANGQEASRRLIGESLVPAVQEIIEYGTAAEVLNSDDRIADVQTNEDGSGLLTFGSGATMKFTSVKNVTATAYTAGRGGAGYITASGTPARAGAVAVDRRVIPLGSKLYIVTDDGKYVYGLAVAEDTGVIGNRVDLYYDDYDECIKFGRRPATIYILED